MNIMRTKRKGLAKAKKEGKEFNRYTSSEMFIADRLNSKFLEWSPIFLGLLWSLAAVGRLHQLFPLCTAWTYVGLRALYIFLILRYGVQTDEMNKGLWLSTFPEYICILGMTLFVLPSLL
mmetsp:Transcript_3582/g.7421  ORF Transcript_3582/g.7421 Transcript_3582/m.7421 type:complete len:120 (+) Transcript_3582:68-427(+)